MVINTEAIKNRDNTLLVIDGVDGCGKLTQATILADRLNALGITSRRISFPCYESESSTLVKMYLRGELGEDPNKIDPYAVSTFYAADRYLSYVMDWHRDYEAGTTIVADRYVSSNTIHQAAKISDKEEKAKFVSWLDSFEHGVYKLPRPTIQFFLDMPAEYAVALTVNRANKFSGEAKKDIHESSKEFLVESYENAMEIAKNSGWKIIHCVQDEKVRSVEDISNEIFEEVIKLWL